MPIKTKNINDFEDEFAENTSAKGQKNKSIKKSGVKFSEIKNIKYGNTSSRRKQQC